MPLLRQVVLLAVAAALSFWLFLAPRDAGPDAAPETAPPLVEEPALPPIEVALREPVPAPAEPRPAAPAQDSSAAAAEPQAGEEPAPPPSELGAHEGEGEEAALETGESEGEALAAAPPVDAADADTEQDAPAEDPSEEAPGDEAVAEAEAAEGPKAPAAAELARDPDLLSAAREELAGRAQQGFATVLLAAPEEQVDIARAFGEELVLVPRASLDPDAREPRYFRLTTGANPRVETIVGRPPLENYRQYRDLFDYEYQRLPLPLRELRRSVLSRNEVFLFAALIPASEWAVVIGRRRAALEETGRTSQELRRAVMRYVRRDDGEIDIVVDELLFHDGERHRPIAKKRGI